MISLGSLVRLDKNEMRYGAWLAKRMGKDVDSRLAQFAAAKLFNRYPDITGSARTDPRMGDFVYELVRISVECAKNDSMGLRIPENLRMATCPDVFVLMQGNHEQSDVFAYLGGIAKHDAIRLVREKGLKEVPREMLYSEEEWNRVMFGG